MSATVDVGAVVDEAKAIVNKAAQVYIHQLGASFVGLVVFGSAVKGGCIPGSSDIDFLLYVDDGILSERGTLPLDLGVQIHLDLTRIDLGQFAYIQTHVISQGHPKPFVGPVPGAYQLVAGRLPVSEATSEELYRNAVRCLDELDPDLPFVTDGLLGHGRINRTVRLLCNYVWPTLFNLLVLTGIEGIKVWNLTKEGAIAVVEGACGEVAADISQFYQAVLRYYPLQSSASDAVAVIRHGCLFLASAKEWWGRSKAFASDGC